MKNGAAGKETRGLLRMGGFWRRRAKIHHRGHEEHEGTAPCQKSSKEHRNKPLGSGAGHLPGTTEGREGQRKGSSDQGAEGPSRRRASRGYRRASNELRGAKRGHGRVVVGAMAVGLVGGALAGEARNDGGRYTDTRFAAAPANGAAWPGVRGSRRTQRKWENRCCPAFFPRSPAFL